MPVDHQPTFNRTSLNILILACVILILIFGQSTQDDASIPMPVTPKLNVSIWQTDSQAQVWFSPKLDEHIYIQLHYLAGFSYNQSPISAGTSQLLVSLLNHQARQLGLPAQAALSPDFIEISIQLNTDPLIMNQQIKGLNSLLYRPTLNPQALSEAKNILPSPLLSLWQQAYSEHAYAGPKQGSPNSMSGIHRAAVQKYQQGFMHPARLFASITGNINEQAAQIIMESLLPIRPYQANQHIIHKTHKDSSRTQSTVHQHDNLSLIVLPGSYEQAEQLAQQFMMINILKQIQTTPMQFITANSHNTLIIEQWPSLLASMDTDLDSDMMRQAKRQSIRDANQRIQTAQALSELLVWLNRHHLPSSFMHQQFSIIENWQNKDWQNVKKMWLQTPQN